jgi:hypothetical protein
MPRHSEIGAFPSDKREAPTNYQTRTALLCEISRVLRGLGTNAVEVASKLQQDHVLGTPLDAEACAIAVYLGAILGPESRIRTIAILEDRLEVLFSWGRVRRVGLPAAVQDFIAEFDLGRHPNLTRHAAEHHD